MFTIITGAQFGDEGKGKIVDLLSSDYDMVVRFQGGDNAGHTVVVDGVTYKLHLVPSGFLTGARILIGPGTVINPEILAKEIGILRDAGAQINPEILGIDAKTSIIMPYHIALDELREAARTEKIGTTKRGIGFAYIDKIARDEVQMADIADEARLRKRIKALAPEKKAAIEQLGGDPAAIHNEDHLSKYIEIGKMLAPYITDVSYEVNTAINEGKNVLAEGAQGTHLDVIHGTQKFVTSSCTIAGSACANIGVGPTKVDNVLAILKAYQTRVGEGPMPVELHDEVGKHLGAKGHEFGTTTGRPRRCGWIDIPLLRKSVNLNGYTGIALTKLDVLSGLSTIKLCTAYELDGNVLQYPPLLTDQVARCTPVYEEMSGWSEELDSMTQYSQLPQAAKAYVTKIEELLGVPIDIISIGPGREQTFRTK